MCVFFCYRKLTVIDWYSESTWNCSKKIEKLIWPAVWMANPETSTQNRGFVKIDEKMKNDNLVIPTRSDNMNVQMKHCCRWA